MVVSLHRRNMKPLQKFYFNMQMFLFPAMEEEIGEMTAKMREFVMLDAIFFVRISRHGLCPLFSSARKVTRPPAVAGA